jgi:hypothetical protein
MKPQVIQEYLSYRPALAPSIVAVPPERRVEEAGVDTWADGVFMRIDDNRQKLFGL